MTDWEVTLPYEGGYVRDEGAILTFDGEGRISLNRQKGKDFWHFFYFSFSSQIYEIVYLGEEIISLKINSDINFVVDSLCAKQWQLMCIKLTTYTRINPYGLINYSLYVHDDSLWVNSQQEVKIKSQTDK